MKVKSIKKIGKQKVYDISVKDEENYVLENGVVTHNTGGMYSSNDVFIVGKRQIKEGTKVIGWQFILNIEKSRVIREKAAIPFDVVYGEGINKYSGLLDMGLASGHIEAPKQGWYTRPGVEGDKNWRRKETSTREFWDPVLKDPTFDEAIKEMYCLSGGNKLLQESLDSMLGIKEGEKFDEETGEILTVD